MEKGWFSLDTISFTVQPWYRKAQHKNNIVTSIPFTWLNFQLLLAGYCTLKIFVFENLTPGIQKGSFDRSGLLYHICVHNDMYCKFIM